MVWRYLSGQKVRVITEIKMLSSDEAQSSESTRNFDHCDEVYRTDNTVPDLIFFTTILTSKKMFLFSERELKSYCVTH